MATAGEGRLFDGLPGADLIEQGMADLEEARVTPNALLVLIAAPRIRQAGIAVPMAPDIQRPVEHRLYEMLQREYGPAAYMRYNALIRRVVSFVDAVEQRVLRTG